MAWGLPDLPSLSGPTAQPQTPLGAVSPESLKARRELAAALQKQGMEATPIRHWLQGLGRVVQSTVGGYEQYQDDQSERAARGSAAKDLADALKSTDTEKWANVATNPWTSAAGQAAVQSQMQPRMSEGQLETTIYNAKGEIIGTIPKTAIIKRKIGDVEDEQIIRGTGGGYREVQEQGVPAPAPRPVQAAPMPPVAPQQPPTPLAPPRASPGQIASMAPMGPDAPTIVGQRWPNDRLVKQTPTPDQVERVVSQAQPQPQAPSPFSERTQKLIDWNEDRKERQTFTNEAVKSQVKRFDELASEGVSAKQLQSDVANLRTLGDYIRTGKMAELKAAIGPYADALGVSVKGLNEIQAFEAVVNRVAPQLRVKGIGAQSDFELRNFLKQMPSLSNTPEGNAIVERTLNGFIQNKLAAAKIGGDALSGKISREDAEKMLRELPDPLVGWREHVKKQKEAETGVKTIGTKRYFKKDGQWFEE